MKTKTTIEHNGATRMIGRLTGRPVAVEFYRTWTGARWARVTQGDGKVVHLTERQTGELFTMAVSNAGDTRP